MFQKNVHCNNDGNNKEANEVIVAGYVSEGRAL